MQSEPVSVAEFNTARGRYCIAGLATNGGSFLLTRDEAGTQDISAIMLRGSLELRWIVADIELSTQFRRWLLLPQTGEGGPAVAMAVGPDTRDLFGGDQGSVDLAGGPGKPGRVLRLHPKMRERKLHCGCAREERCFRSPVPAFGL